MEYPKFKVCVRSFTYNQSAYITDTMNGFVLQETNYPFVCCIVDDCSTDGEQDVIRKYFMANFSTEDANFEQETSYATILYAQHKTNKNCYFAVLLLKENYYSKKQSSKKLEYIKPWRDGCTYDALCEGDDYWIHPHKLQMQTDFLDSHEEYGLVRTNCDTINEKEVYTKSKMTDNFYGKAKDTFKDQLLNAYWLAPCTWMYRKEMSELCGQLVKGLDYKKFFKGDLFLVLTIFKNSKVKYLNETTSVYRILSISASHFNTVKENLDFYRRCCNTRMFFAKDENIIFRIKLKIKFMKPYITSFIKMILSPILKK